MVARPSGLVHERGGGVQNLLVAACLAESREPQGLRLFCIRHVVEVAGAHDGKVAQGPRIHPIGRVGAAVVWSVHVVTAVGPDGWDVNGRLAQVAVGAGTEPVPAPGAAELGEIPVGDFRDERVRVGTRDVRIHIKRVDGTRQVIASGGSVEADGGDCPLDPFGVGGDVVHRVVHLRHGQDPDGALRSRQSAGGDQSVQRCHGLHQRRHTRRVIACAFLPRVPECEDFL